MSGGSAAVTILEVETGPNPQMFLALILKVQLFPGTMFVVIKQLKERYGLELPTRGLNPLPESTSSKYEMSGDPPISFCKVNPVHNISIAVDEVRDPKVGADIYTGTLQI